jgi:hypothetical protein
MGGKGQNFLVVKFKITIHDSLFKVHYYMLLIPFSKLDICFKLNYLAFQKPTNLNATT